MQAVWRVGAASQSLGRPHVAPRGRGLSAPARRVSAPRTAPRARLALVGPCVRRRRPSDARSAERGERRRRPSDARSAERGGAFSCRCLPGCACATGFRTPPLPTAWLRLRRPSDARRAERGARRRRPSDARSAERGGASSRPCLPGCAIAAGICTCAAACHSAHGAVGFRPPTARLRATSERRAQRGARYGFLAPMLARLRERRRHPPAAAAGPAAFEASERRAERGARCAEGTPRDARLSLDTVAMRRCRVQLCVSRGGGEARQRARRFTQVRRRTVVSNCALPSSPSQRMRAAGSRPPPFRRRRCLDLLLLLLYLSAVAGASPASAFAVSAFAAAVAARARPCGKFVALANWLRDGRNVLGPAHSGFLWCMTWSMAATGMNVHVQRWRHPRRHRRQPARQRVKERVICCQHTHIFIHDGRGL